MTDFLLEIRCEEIPARMQAGARAELEKLFRRELTAAGVQPGALTIWSTPRRLALIARDLPAATAAVREETKGPRAGAPPQALEGFLRKTGLTADQLEERDGVLYAVVERPGRAMADVLAEAIPAIVRDFSWPKSMRWGAASLSSASPRWVRPLSGIVAILGDQLVECEAGGVASGYATHGHRFHCPGEITIGSAADYQEKLRACHVIVDHEERAALIREGAGRVAAEAGLTLVADEGLVVENAGLTEWPVPLLGRFDEAFLAVPPEVIQLTARVNQKYFVCNDASGKLANAFVCTANITPSDGGAGVVDGNRKVLAARLSDARFFWEQDQKKTLAQHAEKLARITFHEKLGTVADTVERVAKLARWLVEEGVVKPQAVTPAQAGVHPARSTGAEMDSGLRRNDEEVRQLANLAEQAARLCKADLVTEMVGEFPELQGLMGGYYARVEGLPGEVADAIRDHYKPVGAGDEVPSAPVTVAVSLADKLDTLFSFFAIDEKPTGSKDPFALRRAALGVIRLLQSNVIRLSLSTAHAELVEASPLPVPHGADVARGPSTGSGRADAGAEILDFFADRLKVQQREAGVRHDLIDAVFALGGEDDLVRLLARVHALQAFIRTENGTNLLAGYKRAANILKKEEWTPGIANPAPEPAEQALIDALASAAPRADAALADEDFAAAMAVLASLRAPIDDFFEKVTVNDADAAKRNARLGLLAQFRAAVHKVADFGRIEG